jgi:hypothetical protein
VPVLGFSRNKSGISPTYDQGALRLGAGVGLLPD